MTNFPTFPAVRSGRPNASQMPSQGSTLQGKPDVMKAPFGDGYDQRAINGINNKKEEFAVTWTSCSPFDGLTLYTWLMDLGGAQPFWWRPPSESRYKLWTCEDPKIVRNEGLSADVSGTFVRSFALGGTPPAYTPLPSDVDTGSGTSPGGAE